MAGSLKVPQISEREVVERYLAGESRGMIGLRAKKSDAWVVDVLIRNQVTFRAPSDYVALSIKHRLESKARRERRIMEYARGATPTKRA